MNRTEFEQVALEWHHEKHEVLTRAQPARADEVAAWLRNHLAARRSGPAHPRAFPDPLDETRPTQDPVNSHTLHSSEGLDGSTAPRLRAAAGRGVGSSCGQRQHAAPGNQDSPV
jgi:hypothetical protein